jgi:hypothetical protein
MRGAPQVGFSATIRKIKARSSLLTRFRSYLADSGDPRPIQTKPRTMPVHDGSRSDQDERLPPPGPARSQRNPEQLVQGSQSTARSLRVHSQQLSTESQVFEDEVRPATEGTDQPAEEMSERRDHSQNLIGKVRIKLCAKSFILQVYDVLAGHNTPGTQTIFGANGTYANELDQLGKGNYFRFALIKQVSSVTKNSLRKKNNSRHPHVGRWLSERELESRGKHADDLLALAIKAQRLSDDVAPRAEVVVPETIGDDHHVRAALVFFFFAEIPTGFRNDSKRR